MTGPLGCTLSAGEKSGEPCSDARGVGSPIPVEFAGRFVASQESPGDAERCDPRRNVPSGPPPPPRSSRGAKES